MKEEKLLNAIGKIEDELVLETAPKAATSEPVQENVQQDGENKGSRKQRAWVKWTAMAACVCLLAGVGVLGWKTHFFSVDTPVDQVATGLAQEELATRDDVLEIQNAIEQNQRPAIDFTTTEPQDTALNQNTTATGDELVLLDDFMQAEFPDWGLTLSVKEVTPSGLTLVCTQSGGTPTGDIMTGEDYFLTVCKKEHWRMVPTVIDNYAWNSLAHWVSMGADTELEIDWEWLYGALEPGTYRLVKEFMDFRKTADYDTAGFWVEFVIE